MDPWQIVLIALAVLAIAASFWALVYMVHFTHRTDTWINHHVPLGDNARNARLEAALRDVEHGFNVCATCGEENVHYRIFCVLCGAPVESRLESSDAPEHAVEPTTAEESVPTATLRQRRARTRRTWTRTRDSDGTFRWRYTGPSGTASPAHVVSFRSKNETVHPDGDVCIRVQSEDDTIQEFGNANERVAFDNMPQASAKLDRQVENHKMQISPATDADPTLAVVTLDEPSRLDVDVPTISVVLSMVTAPFPERLATFVTHATAIQTLSGRLSFKIQRPELLLESISLLAALPPAVVSANIRLKFLDEEGIDAGGVYREWFLLLNEAIVRPSAGVFLCADAHSPAFCLNPHSEQVLGEHHLVHFLASGRWLGRALLEGNVVGFHLALPLLKILLGQPVSFADLEFYDRETHKHLQWLLEHDGVEALSLNFTTVEKLPSGDTRVVELVPDGATIDVTDANKHRFVDRKLQYLLFERVEPQLFAFLRGVHEAVPMELLRLFDAEELDYLLAGSDEINVDDWEQHAKYTADLIEHPVREWFWELVRSMTHIERQRLLQYSTGASRVPLAGFSALTSYDGRLCPFTLKGVRLKETAYIRSHACFNTLDLPRYRNKEQLRLMLMSIVLDESQGFTVA